VPWRDLRLAVYAVLVGVRDRPAGIAVRPRDAGPTWRQRTLAHDLGQVLNPDRRTPYV